MKKVMVTEAQPLSETNVRTISQRCAELILKAACIDAIRKDVILPVLQYHSERTPPQTLAKEPVKIAWNLLRQGTFLCMLLNTFRSGILERIHKLKLPITSQVFTDSIAKENLHNFLGACRDDLYMTNDQLFTEANLFTEDTNTLRKAVSLGEYFLDRFRRTTATNFEKKIVELQKTEKLLSLVEEEAPAKPAPKVNSIVGQPEVKKATELRLMVLKEMLQTEQGYVADLDKLQHYAEALRMEQTITPDAHKTIFSNLDQLVDFQRRFLLQMESRLTRAALSSVQASCDAHVGKIFMENEEAFAVYSVFCPNFQRASDRIDLELNKLMTLVKVMEPNVVLRAYLIKPIQRICKYPLLLRELIKQSPPDVADMKELEMALEASKRAAERVNERNRIEQNASVAQELILSVSNWKSIDKTTLGDLLLQDMITVVQGDASRDLELYLFQRILLMCSKTKHSAGYLSATKRSSGGHASQTVIKNYIYTEQVISVTNTTKPSESYTLKITYRDSDILMCSLKFPTEEKLRQWKNSLEKMATPPKPRKRLTSLTQRIDSVPEASVNSAAAAATAIAAAAPISAASAAPVAAPVPAPPERLRLKIAYGGDIFVMGVQEKLDTLLKLRKMIMSKLTTSYALMGKKLSIAIEKMQLRYYDDQKDAILLLDDFDLNTALHFNPTSLYILVAPPSKS